MRLRNFLLSKHIAVKYIDDEAEGVLRRDVSPVRNFFRTKAQLLSVAVVNLVPYIMMAYSLSRVLQTEKWLRPT